MCLSLVTTAACDYSRVFVWLQQVSTFTVTPAGWSDLRRTKLPDMDTVANCVTEGMHKICTSIIAITIRSIREREYTGEGGGPHTIQEGGQVKIMSKRQALVLC